DLQRVVDQAPAGRRAELQDELDFLGEDEPTAVPFGVWVDDEGQVRRLRVDRDDGYGVTIEYWDFGVPVDLTIPSGDDVLSMQDFSERGSAVCADTFGEPQAGDGSGGWTMYAPDPGATLPESSDDGGVVLGRGCGVGTFTDPAGEAASP